MGLFGKKKDFTEEALEEARRFDAAGRKRAKSPNTSVTTTVTTTGDANPDIAALMEKVFGGTVTDATAVNPGDGVTVTTVRHVGANDPDVKEALAAFDFGPLTPVAGAKASEPDDGFSAALDTIERDYKGKPPAEAKAAIKAALAQHRHSIPDQVVDMMAKGVSKGTAIDVKFGGAPPTSPASS